MYLPLDGVIQLAELGEQPIQLPVEAFFLSLLAKIGENACMELMSSDHPCASGRAAAHAAASCTHRTGMARDASMVPHKRSRRGP